MGQIIFDEGAAPSTPSTGKVSMYAKTDGVLYYKDDAGTETSVTGGSKIQPISASVAASALTISASALSLDFRSTTLGSGTVTTVSGTPSNLVISSGSTLGTVNGIQSDIAVLAINNAGAIELAAVNMAGGVDLSETGLISTTAEGGAGGADSATVIYSTTARTNVAYRVIGIIRSTQATAGTWATAPSLVQGAGGMALLTQLIQSPAVATTSGTAIDFTAIPSWVRRITVILSGVSTNGTSSPMVRLGTSGGFVTTGYVSASSRGGSVTSSTSGFIFSDATTAAGTNEGFMQIIRATNNTWTYTSNMALSGNSCANASGTIALAGQLDRLRLTTANGTDTFDAGSVTTYYE